MNALKPTILDPAQVSPGPGERFIGVAVFNILPGACSSLAAQILARSVYGALERADIEAKDMGCLFGSAFLLWTAVVPDRNPALRAIQQHMREMELLGRCEIAFYDVDEEIWRSVHPPGADSFGWLLSEQNIKAAQEQLAREAKALEPAAAISTKSRGAGMSSAPQSFTVAQIARASGLMRQTIHAGLAQIARGIDDGGEGWRFADLPMDWQLGITRRGVKRGFENGEKYLASLPLTPWQCPLTWDRIPKGEQDKAVRLQKALARALALRMDGSATAAQAGEAGLADFRAQFGYAISARHWRRLVNRTIERDGGEENWQRLEIYLDDRAFIASSPAPGPETAEDSHADLADAISALENRQEPTPSDREYLWREVFGHYEQITADMPDSPEGERGRRALKVSLVRYLCQAFPQGMLCATAKSLKRRFEEKLAQYRAAGPQALKDKRGDRSGRSGEKLCAKCRELMIGAVVDLDGNYAQAWRRLHADKKLCTSCVAKWRHEVRERKSYVPKTVIRDIRADVESALSMAERAAFREVEQPAREARLVRHRAW